MKRVIYIGGFEMPDGNAAAQRVFAIAKTLPGDCSVVFLGLTHSDNYSGTVDGYDYKNLPYPATKKEWFSHLSGSRELEYVKKSNPDVVIAYNYPALGLWRMLHYCRKKEIKIIGDVTEWYHPHNALKWMDTEWRMRVLQKKLDGLVVISNYLAEYYADCRIINIPPTVDLQAPIWRHDVEDNKDDRITLLYVGSPGRGDKDKLDTVIDAIQPYANLRLKIVGINEGQYKQLYGRNETPENVAFAGRLSHEDAVRELKNADFSIFFREPTRVNNAGFPTKYAEAAAAGVPVITNHFSDLPKIVIQGKNGFIAENSIESISDIIKAVAGLKRNDVEEMKRYCREYNERFDYRYYTQAMKEFINSVCG